jgi:uncharacterized protein (TIGR00661 family)
VPIINKFIEKGANVIIGADKRPLAFLKNEFPDLKFIQFPGFEVRYPDKGSMVLKMLRSLPQLLKNIRGERKFLEKIISDYKIDVVISDNRYGLHSKNATCVFITHQLNIQSPGMLKVFGFFLKQINRHFVQKYNECWVPDFNNSSSISGELTKGYEKFGKVFFIGMLSRFNKIFVSPKDQKSLNDLLVILSGPEPQRTIFENIILEQLKDIKKLKVLIVRGITESNEVADITENIRMVSHLPTQQIAQAISDAGIILCRPGYSSIMDLAALGKKAIFVPTPGQTEQEYLATYYLRKNIFYTIEQKRFNLSKAIEKSSFYNGLKETNEYKVLDERIQFLVN